jgi:hypothetical protein
MINFETFGIKVGGARHPAIYPQTPVSPEDW